MPFGAPPYVVPKSGCRFRSPHAAINVDDAGSTAAPLTTVFQGLSSGNGRRPLSDAPPPVAVCPPPGSTGVDTAGSLAEEQAASARVPSTAYVVRIYTYGAAMCDREQ